MTRYIPFIDWFKCIGITLIVVGHVAARPINPLTPPIYPKQLGVAFFIFVMGFSLARETRPVRQVLIRRLFEIYLWGILSALLISVILFFITGDLNESNYAPFLAGVNVFFDYFPANPTTWFIGTYLHILLIWAFLFRKIRVSVPLIFLSLVIEIAVRALLITFAGGYIAYMAFPNWISVYMAGAYFAQAGPPPLQRNHPMLIPGLLLLLLSPLVWSRLVNSFLLNPTMPFAHFGIGNPVADPLLTSFLVSAWYFAYSIALFITIRTLHTYRWVRLIARNTIFIFILHMPLYYALDSFIQPFQTTYLFRSFVYIVTCLPLLALVSEALHKIFPLNNIRDRLVKSLVTISPVLPTTK